jgi:hypothetical protein
MIRNISRLLNLGNKLSTVKEKAMRSCILLEVWERSLIEESIILRHTVVDVILILIQPLLV